MKRKSTFILGFVGVLALSISMKDLNTEVFAQDEQLKVKDGQTSTNNGDQYRVVTREEQDMIENIVKIMPAGEVGFLQQEEGTGVFVKKE